MFKKFGLICSAATLTLVLCNQIQASSNVCDDDVSILCDDNEVAKNFCKQMQQLHSSNKISARTQVPASCNNDKVNKNYCKQMRDSFTLNISKLFE